MTGPPPGFPSARPRVSEEPRLQPGDAAPDFILPSLSGDRTVRLADLRGHITVLFFVREFS
ncbi:MAG: redoxin domain-containing protein [Longimicrobiales bacterium]